MAELKRYADFAGLKSVSKPKKKSDIIDSGKTKELEKFFEVLRNNLSTKKTL